MIYTKEWFTFHLVKLNDLFCSAKFENFEALMDEEEMIVKAVVQTTGMSAEEACDLVAKKLMPSEAERQRFFSRYGVLSESANICKQMLAVV